MSGSLTLLSHIGFWTIFCLINHLLLCVFLPVPLTIKKSIPTFYRLSILTCGFIKRLQCKNAKSTSLGIQSYNACSRSKSLPEPDLTIECSNCCLQTTPDDHCHFCAYIND